jgi:hypothetical protein
MPDSDGELARDRNGCAAPPCDAVIESPQWSRSAYCLPGRFDQHRPGMSAALFADPTVPGPPFTGLMNGGVETEIGDQPIRTRESIDRTDCSQQSDCDHHIDPGNGHEPLGFRVGERVARQFALDYTKILSEAVIIAQVPMNSLTFIGR